MAGNYYGQRILARRAAHCSGFVCIAEPGGNFTVAAGFAIGNKGDLRPDRLLEGRSLRRQRQVKHPPLSDEIFRQLSLGLAEQRMPVRNQNSGGQLVCFSRKADELSKLFSSIITLNNV